MSRTFINQFIFFYNIALSPITRLVDNSGSIMPKLPEKFPFEREDLVYKVEQYNTNDKWGFIPNNRPIEKHLEFAVINLDKPPNLTSHEVSAYISKLMGIKKVAHGGTLDPGVSGILPIALQRATPLSRILLKSDKEYIVVMRLHKKVSEEEIIRVVNSFKGKIYQRPPIRSAVTRKTRVRTIYDIEVIEVENRDVLMRVHCEAGTYMRKLCTDIGDILGVGAHMIDLRRVKSGVFYEDETLCTMQDLIDAWITYKEYKDESMLRRYILPAEVVIINLPRIIVNDGAVGALTHGAQLYVPGIIAFSSDIEKGEIVVILTIKGELIALAKSIMSAKEILEAEKGQVTDDTRVLMPRDLYPPMWRRKTNNEI